MLAGCEDGATPALTKIIYEEKEKMLCPLKFAGKNDNQISFCECESANCAFWIEEKNCCSIKSIASDLHEFIDSQIPRLRPQ